MTQLPHSKEIERGVLGAILLDASAELVTDAAARGLRPQDFYLDGHRRLYRRIVELAMAGKPIEIPALLNAMTEPGESEAIGGYPFLSDISSGSVRKKSIDAQVDTLLELSRRRELYHVCQATSVKLLDRTEDTQQCFSEHDEARLRIELGGQFQLQRFRDYSEAAWMRLKELINQPRVGYPTGLPYLDYMTTGLRRQELWLLGGRTGEGKSCFANQVARENAKRGTPVGFLSPEMTKWQILYRMWVHETGVSASKIRDPHRLNVDEMELLAGSMGPIAEWPIYVDDRSGMNVSQMAASARLMVRRHKCEILIVDYVQLIQAAGADPRERITVVSQTLMQLKKELDVAILALSQMPRPSDPNQRPNKYSFKESGSLENDADCVAAIYRPVDDDNQWVVGTEEIDILKQREGKIGIVQVSFSEQYLRFIPRDATR